MLILPPTFSIKYGDWSRLRSLPLGFRTFSACRILKHEDLAVTDSISAESKIEVPQLPQENDKGLWSIPWKLQFYTGAPKNRTKIAYRALEKPDDHPIRNFHATIYIPPNGLMSNKSEQEDFVGNICKVVREALAPPFSTQSYAARLWKRLEEPDGHRLICKSSFSIIPPVDPSELPLFDITIDRQKESVVFKGRSSWPLTLHGHETGQTGLLKLTTGYDVTQSVVDESNNPAVDSQTSAHTALNSHVPKVGFDLIHPLSSLHKLIKDHVGNVIKEPSITKILKSASRMGFRTADSYPQADRMLYTNMTISESSAGRSKAEPIHLEMNRVSYEKSGNKSGDMKQVYVAIGSNMGDRTSNIDLACSKMTKSGIVVVRTSSLYETQPMYFEEQGLFLNCVCEVRTSLGPLELLEKLKSIEIGFGRQETVRNGPRVIDLDILLYNRQDFESDTLSIPHKKMMEREFVLRPLCDLIPDYAAQLKKLASVSTSLSPMTPISAPIAPLKSMEPERPTSLMTIVNMTPDSFSDGGARFNEDPETIISNIKKQLDLTRGTPIIDVGGQSTRPNVTQVPEEEELSRILPTIKAIRSDPFFDKVAISVDTYRASVASAAIEAGANIVNDVSAGRMDPQMLPTIARLGCTCILMHMRGTPQTMSNLTNYPEGVVNGVARELKARVNKAQLAGIRRWRICLDPGIGFAKTQEQNLELLRRFDELKAHRGLRGFPWVVGVSRKGFIGKVTGVEAADQREFGTAAAVTAAIRGGADIVRAHDTEKMGQVVKMADAIWRTSSKRSKSGLAKNPKTKKDSVRPPETES